MVSGPSSVAGLMSVRIPLGEERRMARFTGFLLALLAVALPVYGQAPLAPATPSPEPSPGEKYAQYLVDSLVALHPELSDVDVHATPPGSAQSAVVAAKTPSRVGK